MDIFNFQIYTKILALSPKSPGSEVSGASVVLWGTFVLSFHNFCGTNALS